MMSADAIRSATDEGRQFDVVGWGQNSVDYVAVVAAHPGELENQLARLRTSGGQVATAMVTCSRLG